MISPKVYINGSLLSDTSVKSFIFDPLAPHVFETMAAFRGVIFRLNEHMTRLCESARTIHLYFPFEQKLIEQTLIKAAAIHDEMTCVRLMVTNTDFVIWTFQRALPENFYSVGIQLMTSATRRTPSASGFPEAKTNQFLNGILSALDFREPQPFETLMLDSQGLVKESRVWNLFIVKKNLLKTPTSDGILNGVTRNFVIECAQKEEIPVMELPLTRHDVWNSDEAFLTNTTGGILPAVSLDGRTIGRKIPGKITKLLSNRYQTEFLKELQKSSNGKN